jgi:hypothetical protein
VQYLTTIMTSGTNKQYNTISMGIKTLSLKFGLYFSTALTAFFLPITWAITSVVAIVLIDTITGVMSAGKDNIKNISSRKLSNVISKLIYYLFALILCRIAVMFIDNSVPFVKLCLIAVFIIEIKSIDENFYKTFKFSFVDKMLTAIKKFNRK